MLKKTGLPFAAGKSELTGTRKKQDGAAATFEF
jgi:hypothetical protein